MSDVSSTPPGARPGRAVLTVSSLRRAFPVAGGGSLDVLNGIDLEIRAGEIVAIIGQSGAGKSTLLHLMGLLDTPTAGEVCFEGRNVAYLTDRERARIRNRAIGFVFQMYYLIPELTALENVFLPAMIQRSVIGWPGARGKARARATELLAAVGLSERTTHRPSQLSGGESQRVALARALMHRPDVVLCDEPTGNLDPSTKDGIHELIVRLNRDENQTFVLVTHDPSLTQLAHRVLEIGADGRILERVQTG